MDTSDTSHSSSYSCKQPLEFIAMDILVPLQKTPNGIQFFIIVTDRYYKLPLAIPLSNTVPSRDVLMFIDKLNVLYDRHTFLLPGNGAQIVSIFLDSLCSVITVEWLMTTANHGERNSETDGSNKNS